jgi:hypothetical protein
MDEPGSVASNLKRFDLIPSFFRPVIETIQKEPVVFVEKSRDLMISWLCVGFFTHAAMTNEQREVLFPVAEGR